MTLLLASAARATVGGRSGQEDAFRLWPAEGAVPPKAEGGGLLAVLADGMGGHTGGAIAGQTACKTFAEVFSSTPASAPLEARLKSALQASNEALAKGVEQNAALKGMGCTIVAAWIDDLGIRWTSVGDSLLLLYRLPDVIRLNADHSLGSFLDEQARQNKITRSEARRNRNRNALRSALTGSKIDLIDLHGEPLELRPADWVLLASDGICSLPGDEIADVVYRFRQSTPEEMAEGLIAAVTQKGVVDQDNTTVVAVRIDGAPEASDDVTTRVVIRPKGEEADLRTRRIGVSRRGPARRRGAGKTRAAVWLVAAVALAFCAVALMLAVPSLRPTMPTSPEAAAVPGTGPTTAPPNAAVNPAPATAIPAEPSAKPSAKPAPELPAQVSPPAASPGKPAGVGQEGSAPTTPPAKSTATPPPASPPAPPGEGEEGATSRSSVSKPAGSQPIPPSATTAAPTAEGEEDAGSRASVTKPPAPVPVTKPPRPSGAKVQGGAPASPASKPAIAGESGPSRLSKEQERNRTKPGATPETTPGPIPGTTSRPALEEPREVPGRAADPLSSAVQ